MEEPGSIAITVTGGNTGNYTYTWTTTDGAGIVQGAEDQGALAAGTYHLVVKDSNNCVAVKDITLTQPQQMAITLDPKDISCFPAGFSNGEVNLTVTGGVIPYIYNWSNGATTEDITGLTEGYYRVTVTDPDGCQVTSVLVNLPPPLLYTKTLSNHNGFGFNVSCYGLSDVLSVFLQPAELRHIITAGRDLTDLLQLLLRFISNPDSIIW